VTPSLVCGFDGSVPARAAARLGAALAGRLGLGLVLVHAVDRAGRRSEAMIQLRELQGRLAVPGARLQVELGPPAERLAAAAHDAAFLVVGAAEHRAGVRAALARRAPCPLAVVPAVPRLGGASVLCGVRDWADVDTATVAARLARALGLPLTLTHVLSPVGAPDPGLFGRPWDDESAHRLLDAVAGAVHAAAARRVVSGAAGPVLAREAAAAQAGMLVVGAPLRGRLGAALSGSASGYLMRHTRRPLIVCRTGLRPPDPVVRPRPAAADRDSSPVGPSRMRRT
jgi:nucleotide-binding universal stress UspA family protein